MEKVIYVLWRDTQAAPDQWSRTVRAQLADRLLSLGAHGVQVNVADADVAPAVGEADQHASWHRRDRRGVDR